MYKAKDLRDQNLEELEVIYDDSCKKLFVLVNELKSQKKREKPHEIKQVRKDIARILMVISEKNRESQTQKA